MGKSWRRAAVAGALATLLLPGAGYGFDVDLTDLEALRALGIKTVADIPVGKTGFITFAFGFCNHDGQAYLRASTEVKDAGETTLDKILIMRSGEREVTIDLLPGKDPKDRSSLRPILTSISRFECSQATADGSMDGFYAITTISGHRTLSDAIREVAGSK